MTELKCMYNKCIHHNFFECTCQLESVRVEDIECGECYEPITEQAEYQTEYWIRCKDERTGTNYKQKKKGKRIEVDGVVLYTDEKLPPEAEWANPQWYTRCTEEKTGMIVSLHSLYIPERRKRIDEYIKNAVPFSELEERAEEDD